MRLFLIIGAIYLFVVLSLWAPFGHKSGMPHETAFVHRSESKPVIRGFFYKGDRLRIHTMFFYHLSYLLAEVLGIGGSFLTYQIVYALLWWARGVLVFLILRELLPQFPLFHYLIGSFVIVHASDHALNWVGQLNQFGMIFWMLLSFYMLLCGLKNDQRRPRLYYLGLSLIFAYMSLWSYESQVVIVLIVPVLLLILCGFTRRNVILIGTYYIVPAIYLALNALRYLHAHRRTYQESVLRDDFGAYPILNDLWFNIAASLKFWTWADLPPTQYAVEQTLLFPCITSALFVVGALIVRQYYKSPEDPLFPDARNLLVMLIVGLILLAASFPAYLILNSARGLWRTQFLSGLGTAVALGSFIGLVTALTTRGLFRFVMVLSFGAIVSFFGSSAALKAGAFHYEAWERHRQVMAQVLQLIPKIKPKTVIVLTNVPKDADPFGDNMWFDVAVRLAYPGSIVAGLYFYADRSPSPGSNFVLRSGQWESNKNVFPALLSQVSLSQTLFLEYNEIGCIRLRDTIPNFLVRDNLSQSYDSSSLVEKGPTTARAIRRYCGMNGCFDKRCSMSPVNYAE